MAAASSSSQPFFPKATPADRLPTYLKGDDVPEIEGAPFVSTMIKIKPIQYANIDTTIAKKEYKSITKYIRHHPIGKILYSVPDVIFQNHLCEFWITSEVSNTECGEPCIVATVNNTASRIVLTLRKFKEIFNLEYKIDRKYESVPSLEMCKSVLSKLGYSGNIRGSVKIGFLSGIWKYLLSTITRSLQTKVGGFDTPNKLEMQIFYCMVTNRLVDFGSLIFRDLVSKICSKTENVYYSRILGITIGYVLKGDYRLATGPTVEVKSIGSSIFSSILSPQPLTHEISKYLRNCKDNESAEQEMETETDPQEDNEHQAYKSDHATSQPLTQADNICNQEVDSDISLSKTLSTLKRKISTVQREPASKNAKNSSLIARLQPKPDSLKQSSQAKSASQVKAKNQTGSSIKRAEEIKGNQSSSKKRRCAEKNTSAQGDNITKGNPTNSTQVYKKSELVNVPTTSKGVEYSTFCTNNDVVTLDNELEIQQQTEDQIFSFASSPNLDVGEQLVSDHPNLINQALETPHIVDATTTFHNEAITNPLTHAENILNQEGDSGTSHKRKRSANSEKSLTVEGEALLNITIGQHHDQSLIAVSDQPEQPIVPPQAEVQVVDSKHPPHETHSHEDIQFLSSIATYLQKSPIKSTNKDCCDLFPEILVQIPSTSSDTATLSSSSVVDQLTALNVAHKADNAKLIKRMDNLDKKQKFLESQQADLLATQRTFTEQLDDIFVGVEEMLESRNKLAKIVENRLNKHNIEILNECSKIISIFNEVSDIPEIVRKLTNEIFDLLKKSKKGELEEKKKLVQNSEEMLARPVRYVNPEAAPTNDDDKKGEIGSGAGRSEVWPEYEAGKVIYFEQEKNNAQSDGEYNIQSEESDIIIIELP